MGWRDIAKKGLDAAKTELARQSEVAAATAERLVETAKADIARKREEAAANIERLKKHVAEEQEKERLREIEEAGRKTRELQALREPRSHVETDFVKAEYGVPHCNFSRTQDGFRVSIAARGFFLIYPTAKTKIITIEVTRTAVIIDDQLKVRNRKMTRRDFGKFYLAQEAATPNAGFAILGYQYGNQYFPFGGLIDDREAREIASALNRELVNTPQDGDENQTSPAALRTARPTDF